MAVQEFTPEELKTEEWRPIAGYEGIYSVSNLGRVRRDIQIRSHVPRLLSPSIYSRGYVVCALHRNSVATRRSVHRMVAQAFLGECPLGHQVNHKDGHKANNRVRNLEYVTPSENKRHSVWVLGKRHAKKLTGQQVILMRKLRNEGYTCTALGLLFAVDRGTAKRIIRRKTWQHI